MNPFDAEGSKARWAANKRKGANHKAGGGRPKGSKWADDKWKGAANLESRFRRRPHCCVFVCCGYYVAVGRAHVDVAVAVTVLTEGPGEWPVLPGPNCHCRAPG